MAEERANEVLARGEDDVRPSAVQVAHAARVLCRAQRGEQRGAIDAFQAVEAVPVAPAHVLRAVHQVLRAALRGRAAAPVTLDGPPVGEPLGQKVLVALGIVEVADATGRVLRVGGDAERAVAKGRRCLAGDFPGRPPQAVEDLLTSSSHGQSPWNGEHPRTVLEARVLAGILAAQRGDEQLALRRMAEALELAGTTGIRAPFISHGRHVRPLFEHHLADLGSCAGLAVELADRLAGPHSDVAIEPLTEREREVLHHLPTLMSNVEIAQGMHVSVNTVKTHLKAVYRKLGVDGRRQAVLRGRELELI